MLSFYDRGWYQRYEIDYDVYHKFINCNYNLYCNSVICDKLKPKKDMIKWFNSTCKITQLNNHLQFRAAILHNNIKLIKILHEIRSIDLKKEFWIGDKKTLIFTEKEIINCNVEIKKKF